MTEDTPEQARFRASLQRAADSLERCIDRASDPSRKARLRMTDVRYGRTLLSQLEDAAGQMASGQKLGGAEEARNRLDAAGDELGMSRDDVKPRLADRPEFRPAASRIRRRGQRTKH